MELFCLISLIRISGSILSRLQHIRYKLHLRKH